MHVCSKFLSICLFSLVALSLEAREGKAEGHSHHSSFVKTTGSNPARFEKIKIDPTKAKNEIDFWSRQLSEHALFLSLGIVDDTLKQRGKDIHNEFENYRNNISEKNMTAILPLVQKLRVYKMDVLNKLNEGKWIGWIFPLFVQHTIFELDYFIDKLNAVEYNQQQEIDFWNIVNGEHASFAAHLLDPSEKALFDKANEFSDKFVSGEEEMMIQISLKYSKELDEFNKQAQNGIKDNKVKSIIHPVLIDHVIREGQRSIETLEKFTRNKQTS